MTVKCKICNIECKSLGSLSRHIVIHHITPKQYYDKYMKKPNDGKCITCGKEVPFRSLTFGYKKYCSQKCVANDPNVKKKKVETCIKNYGVSSPLQNKELKEKRYQTNIKKYGKKHLSQVKEIRDKMNKTLNETYDKNKDEIIAKRKMTCYEKYGTISPMELKEILEKRKLTWLKNMGVDHSMKDDDIKNRWMIQVYRHKIDKINKLLDSVKDLCEFKYNIDEMISNKDKRIWICKLCGKENTFHHFSFDSFKCECNRENLLEREFRLFLEENNIRYNQFDRNIINPYEIDFYLPDYNIGIELHGLYWHSEKILAKNNTEEELLSYEFKNKQNQFMLKHYNKFKLCLDANIHLIQIFEDEWVDKKEIVKSRIKHMTGKNNKIIYGRQCEIKEIKADVKDLFLFDNHLQGSDRAKYKYGAFYKNELVAVMTFALPNVSKGGVKSDGIWELSRFAIKRNYNVIGIADKLFKHFIRNNEFKKIFSYCDLRWSTGNVYKKLGFQFTKWTGVGYWYTDFTSRIHRYNLRKTIDDPTNIQEWLLRWSENLYRIWDCGNYLFEYYSI